MTKLTHIFRWLWDASKGYRLSITVVGLISTLSVAVAMTNVWISKRLIDIATHNAEGNLAHFIILFASCAVLQIVFSIIISRLETKTEVSLRNALRHKYFTRIMESRWLGKETFHTGDMLSRLDGDVTKVADTLSRTMPAVIATALQLLAALFFLGSMDWHLALVVLLIMPVALLLSRAYVSRMRRLTNDIRTTDSRINAHLQENIQHRALITSFENTDQAIESLDGYHGDLQRQTITRNNYNLFSRGIVQLGFSAGYVTAFSWGVTGIAAGTITFGTMAAFLQLVGQIQRPISRMSRQFATAVHTVTSVDRLCELELPQELRGEPIKLDGQVGVRFTDVDFTYPDAPLKTIEGFSHDFQPGSLTAVVGETGIGKSTLIRLMLSLLSPDKGNICFYNSENQVEISPRTRCNIVYVPQGNTLVSGTIRDNLQMGKPDASEDEMREALYTAVAEFVYDLPDALDTVCGEKGAGLSEGQAQRIAIARALLRPGRVILLDEPTSALDGQTEQLLLQRIRARLEGRTLIMVTHNQQTAGLCTDKVRMS